MKKLKKKQLGLWCSYCTAEAGITGGDRQRAIYVSSGWCKFSCEDHKEELLDYEKRNQEMGERMTEADNQTWENL